MIEPAELLSRTSACDVIRQLKGKAVVEISNGPLYAAEVELNFESGKRRVGFLGQDRTVNNGVWGPEHHVQAAEIIRAYGDLSMPVVTFMDTPGADAGAAANQANQAHTISRLLAEMCNLQVATVGIVYGLGYSGGAIPLAATNVLLCVRSGVFNTIQPKGLASIARKFNLSWQECARYVGLSSYELLGKGVVDGVIDYAPEDPSPDVARLQAGGATRTVGAAVERWFTPAFRAAHPEVAGPVRPGSLHHRDRRQRDADARQPGCRNGWRHGPGSLWRQRWQQLGTAGQRRTPGPASVRASGATSATVAARGKR